MLADVTDFVIFPPLGQQDRVWVRCFLRLLERCVFLFGEECAPYEDDVDGCNGSPPSLHAEDHGRPINSGGTFDI